jgi:5-deoxy-D-glucuronate isomerase
MFETPRLITFPKIGNSSLGYISPAENENLPFEVKRIYWTYFTPEDVQRGGHAHHDLEQILVAVAGKITVQTEMPDGTKHTFVLDSPSQGVYLPKYSWHIMQYSHNAVQMCIASMVYEESDYIRDYNDFLKINTL